MELSETKAGVSVVIPCGIERKKAMILIGSGSKMMKIYRF